MTIWVDADACPTPARDILCRAAERAGITTTFVANRPISLPRSPYLNTLQVMPGFDVADNEIVVRVEPGDLVVTADIPLAAEVIAKQAEAISPRGEVYSPETIRERLNMRDFMDTMRASGIQTGGTAPYSQKTRQDFANALDRYVERQRRQKGR